jgi:hypothetical protein
MEQSYINYADRLNTIGELIVSISDLVADFSTVKDFSLEEYRTYEKNLSETIERYEYASDSLASVRTPFVIQNQHKKLVERLDDYIESIRILKGSIWEDSSGFKFNEEEYNRGLSLQQESVQSIEKLATLIGDKLTGTLK